MAFLGGMTQGSPGGGRALAFLIIARKLASNKLTDPQYLNPELQDWIRLLEVRPQMVRTNQKGVALDQNISIPDKYRDYLDVFEKKNHRFTITIEGLQLSNKPATWVKGTLWMDIHHI